MGTWGTEITSDDIVTDVTAFMVDRLKEGNDLAEATEKALSNFRASIEDADTGPLIWLGIAHIQWKYGLVSDAVLCRIREDVESERGLERWREEPVLLRERIDALSRFVVKISEANPRPATKPKIISRPAPFAAGDCLSILTADLRYTAAIVLAVDNSNIEHGANLIGSLDFIAATPPTAEVFEQRQWLRLHHGNWNGEQELSWFGPSGLKNERKRFSVVCRTKIRFFDPKKVNSFEGWNNLGSQILLCRAASES